MPPPNPLKPIQEALERVLHESGLHDFGRSMSSIDDLTAEVQHVYQRVDDIERVLETIVPILERLTVVFEDIHAELEPMSELASKIPGSGSRRRRRAKEGAALELSRPAVAPPPAPGSVRADAPPRADGVPPVTGADLRRAAEGAPAPGTDPSPGAGPSSGRPPFGGPGPATGPTPAPPPSGGGGAVRPGATGYSPLGPRDHDQH